jgi:hypothetical protein
MYPRRFARIRPTGSMAGTVKVQVGPKAPLIDCKLVDYSAGGACLEVFGQVTLPARFEMFYGGVRKRCRIVWTKGRRVGVSF